MSSEFGVRSSESKDIWIWVHSREGEVEEVTQGLAGEARRLLLESGGKGNVVAVAFGPVLEEGLRELGAYGVDRVFLSEATSPDYQGEVSALLLGDLVKKHNPAYFLMAHTAETSDLAPRLAAALETGLVTRAMDVQVDDQGKAWAIRPAANGHLFEKIYFADQEPHILTLLPSVLSIEKIPVPQSPEMITIPFPGPHGTLPIKLLERIEALPECLDLEEADIIIAAGRGVGRDEAAFSIIQEMAGALGGTVAGTRPLIDWKTLPFEKQIGQTGKTVVPRLLIACGISGANEFTVGMEKSRLVVAIDTDPQARIFRFADLGVVGDVHQVLPLLIEAIQKMKEGA